MKKIFIAGDSFGLPRPFKMTNDIEIQYENGYPVQLQRLLSQQYPEEEILVINQCKRVNTSLGVYYDLKNPRFGEIYLSQPDYLVVQVGNVDCFERGKHHDEFAPYTVMRGRNPWINANEFLTIMGEIIKMTIMAVPPLQSIILVNIPPIAKEENRKNRETRKRISFYNLKLKAYSQLPKTEVADIYRLFATSKEPPLCSDGIHPNEHGSRLIAKAIFDKIVGG